MPMMPANQVSFVERTYAQALLELASDAGQLDAIAGEMAELGDLIQAQPALLHLLSNRVLSISDRSGSIERLFKGKVSDLVYRFLLVVNDHGRLASLPGMLRGFKLLVEEKQGRVEADVYTAEPLDAARTQEIAAKLGAALQRQVVLRSQVDPALIGGLKVRVGDRIIDGSVATQLRLIKQKLVDAGREKARTTAV